MTTIYQDLGPFSDWVAEAQRQHHPFPVAHPGPETQQRVREVMGFCNGVETPREVQSEQTWERDGIVGERVSWSVGYGPRTEAYVLRPANATGKLPGILALHDHGGFKFYGKEKIADGPDDAPDVLVDFRKDAYGGRAYANELARQGFVVVVPDTFLWGSRRFPLEVMPDDMQAWGREYAHSDDPQVELAREAIAYNRAAGQHEHIATKYANLLGTSMAGVVCYEDRIALNYLLSRADVDSQRVGCIGLSGGGNRAAMLTATHDSVSATVIVGLMSTYAGLLNHNVASHTWMLYPFNWSRYGDWPDLAACRAPSPMLVQYDSEDELFSLAGMEAAHERLTRHFAGVGHPENYVGQFYPGPHKFDLEMQAAAFAWLQRTLST